MTATRNGSRRGGLALVRRGVRAGGPHDVDDIDPGAPDAPDVVDFGAVRVPVPARGTVGVEPTASGRMQAVHISLPEGRLSVSALAAPKSSALWPDLAAEIATSLRDGGARLRSYTGEWGRELHATTGAATSVFVGVDGPRWMLYGVATGPTTDAAALDVELRRLLSGTIVVRGRSPYPVRTVLPLVVPEHLAEAAAEAEAAAAAAVTAGEPGGVVPPASAAGTPAAAPADPPPAARPGAAAPPTAGRPGAVSVGAPAGHVSGVPVAARSPDDLPAAAPVVASAPAAAPAAPRHASMGARHPAAADGASEQPTAEFFPGGELLPEGRPDPPTAPLPAWPFGTPPPVAGPGRAPERPAPHRGDTGPGGAAAPVRRAVAPSYLLDGGPVDPDAGGRRVPEPRDPASVLLPPLRRAPDPEPDTEELPPVPEPAPRRGRHSAPEPGEEPPPPGRHRRPD